MSDSVLDRIREIKAMATEDEEDASREPLGVLKGDVVFDDVSFEYEPGVPVLKHVSFAAAAGTTTALVGSSGHLELAIVGDSAAIMLGEGIGAPVTLSW